VAATRRATNWLLLAQLKATQTTFSNRRLVTVENCWCVLPRWHGFTGEVLDRPHFWALAPSTMVHIAALKQVAAIVEAARATGCCNHGPLDSDRIAVVVKAPAVSLGIRLRPH